MQSRVVFRLDDDAAAAAIHHEATMVDSLLPPEDASHLCALHAGQAGQHLQGLAHAPHVGDFRLAAIFVELVEVLFRSVAAVRAAALVDRLDLAFRHQRPRLLVGSGTMAAWSSSSSANSSE